MRSWGHLSYGITHSVCYNLRATRQRWFLRSVGIDLKELGVSCWNVWNFAQGLKFKADFHSKMSISRHEQGERGSDRPPPPTIPTLFSRLGHLMDSYRQIEKVAVKIVFLIFILNTAYRPTLPIYTTYKPSSLPKTSSSTYIYTLLYSKFNLKTLSARK